MTPYQRLLLSQLKYLAEAAQHMEQVAYTVFKVTSN